MKNNCKTWGFGFIRAIVTVKTQGLSFIRAIIGVTKTGFCLGLLPEPCVFACVLAAKMRTHPGLVLVTRKHEKEQGSGNDPMQNLVFLQS